MWKVRIIYIIIHVYTINLQKHDIPYNVHQVSKLNGSLCDLTNVSVESNKMLKVANKCQLQIIELCLLPSTNLIKLCLRNMVVWLVE